MANFIPDHESITAEMSVPWFEDVRATTAPGYSTVHGITELKQQIVTAFSRLGAHDVTFMQGKYPGGTVDRFGFRIDFHINGRAGRIDAAALPIRNETEIKKDKALRQALFLVRDRILAEVHASAYMPGTIPLMPYLLGKGDRTLTEEMVESGALKLPAVVYE